MQYDCSIILPHAIVVSSYNSENALQKVDMLRKIAKFEEALGRYKDAYQHMSKAYNISRDILGESNMDIINIKVDMGVMLYKLGSMIMLKSF